MKRGAVPPVAPRIEVAAYSPSPWGNPTSVARDSLGIAKGGIRLPDIEVPTSVNFGENALLEGVGNCRLYGSWSPLPISTLESLYQSKPDYVAKVTANVNSLVSGGFINEADGRKMIDEASRSRVGDRPSAFFRRVQ